LGNLTAVSEVWRHKAGPRDPNAVLLQVGEALESDGATVVMRGPGSLVFSTGGARVHGNWSSWKRSLEEVEHGVITVTVEGHAFVIRAEVDPPRRLFAVIAFLWIAIIGSVMFRLSGVPSVLFGVAVSLGLPAISHAIGRMRLQAYVDHLAVRIASATCRPDPDPV
jgi:hypothetical protein